MPSITPFLWFDTDLAEPIEFYTSIFPDADSPNVRPTDDGPIFPRTVVTLHADGFDEDNGQRWTVFAVGHARRVEGSDSPGLAGVSLSSGSDAVSVERGDLFRLQPEIFSGRWIESL
jgi:3-demethylubiquinone-9 3-methyltransferase